MRTITFLLLAFFIAPGVASAQIVINEISPASDPEWVELLTTQDSNMQNCILYLHESEDTKQKISFPDSLAITANSYLVIKKGERGWSSNWLNNSGDTVKLVCPNSTDSYTYENVDGKTVGRSPDGTGSFAVLTNPSEGGANAPPTPRPTPKATEPAKTVTPPPAVLANTATPISTVKPSFTTSTTPKPERTIPSTQTLQTIDPTQAPEIQKDDKHSLPIFSYSFIGVGIVLTSVGAYPFAKKLYNNKHGKHAPDETLP